MISRLAAFSLLLMLFVLAGCPSSKIVYPVIANDAAEIQRPGKFVWHDLYATDMTACENFYEAMFDWDFRRTNETVPRVKTIFRKGRPIGNMIGSSAAPGTSRWLSYISTENVDTTLKLATDNGGAIYVEAKEQPDRGRVAVVMDPQGAPFGLLDSPVGDPADTMIRPDMWLGCELWSLNLKDSAKFYQAVIGYDIKPMKVHETVDYWVLQKQGKRRGGIVGSPWKDIKPEWVPFISVYDVAALVAKAERLGGRVIIKPDLSVAEGRVAVIADPAGAVFGIHQMQ